MFYITMYLIQRIEFEFAIKMNDNFYFEEIFNILYIITRKSCNKN